MAYHAMFCAFLFSLVLIASTDSAPASNTKRPTVQFFDNYENTEAYLESCSPPLNVLFETSTNPATPGRQPSIFQEACPPKSTLNPVTSSLCLLFAHRIHSMCAVSKAMSNHNKEFNNEIVNSFLQYSQTAMDEKKFCVEMTAAPQQGQQSITLSGWEIYIMQKVGVEVAGPSLPLDPYSCSQLWKLMDCDMPELNLICQAYAFLATKEGPMLESQKVTLDNPEDLQPNEPQSPGTQADSASDQSKTARNPDEQGKDVEENQDAELKLPSSNGITDELQPNNPVGDPINETPAANEVIPVGGPINEIPAGNPGNPAAGDPINETPATNPLNQIGGPINEYPVGNPGNPPEGPINEIPAGNPVNPSGGPINENPAANLGNPVGGPINEIGNPGNPSEGPINDNSATNLGNPVGGPINEIPVGNPGNPSEGPINENPAANLGNPVGGPIYENPVGNPGNPSGGPINENPAANLGNPVGGPINEIPAGNPGNPSGGPINENPAANLGNPVGGPIYENPVGNPGNPSGGPINENPAANLGNPVGGPINEIPAGNPGNPSGGPINENPAANLGNPVGVPINEIPAGNPGNPSGGPINENPDANLGNPVGGPIYEIPVGNPGNPSGGPINENPAANPGNPSEGPINDNSATNLGNPAEGIGNDPPEDGNQEADGSDESIPGEDVEPAGLRPPGDYSDGDSSEQDYNPNSEENEGQWDANRFESQEENHNIEPNPGNEENQGLRVQHPVQNVKYEDDYDDDDANTHFMAYSLTAIILILATYIMYHNKQKIIAVVVEGRNGRGRRRRGGSGYQKLDQNISEAMPSMHSQNA